MLVMKEKKLSLNLYDDSTVKWEYGGKRYCLHIQQDKWAEDPRDDEANITIMACWHGRYSLGDDTGAKTPEDFWRRLVRENVPYGEIYATAKAGRLPGIRLAPNPENPELTDVYETYFFRTVAGSSDPDEYLEYEALRKDAVAEYILDDLTVPHCMTLMKPYAEWLPLWLYDHGGITMSCGARHYPYNDRWDSGQAGWIITLKKTVMETFGETEDGWRELAADVMQSDAGIYDHYLTGEVYGYTLYEERNGEWEDTGDSGWGYYGSDILESNLAEDAGSGLLKAIQEGRYKVGTAKWHTIQHPVF